MLTKKLFAFFIISATIIISFSCERTDENLEFNTVLESDDLFIHDILVVNDSVIYFSGETNLGNGILGKYIVSEDKKSSRKENSIKTEDIISDISISSEGLWACGKNMLLLNSTNEGKTWNTPYSFDYFWIDDKSDFTKLHAIGNTPTFAIGDRNILKGNFYYKKTNSPFASEQINMGVNDMAVIDSANVYIAGFGSIMLIKKNSDKTINIKHSNIGGEDFTGIVFAGNNTLVTCTASGKIYSNNLLEDNWKLRHDANISFSHIASDKQGNLMCVGNKDRIYFSNNFGKNWTELKYKLGSRITCLFSDGNRFWVGNDRGEIIRFKKDQLTF